MSEPRVVQPVAVEDEPNPAPAAPVPEIVLPEGESVQNETSQAAAVESFKTLELLKKWQIIPYILKRAQDAYNRVKHSTKITETGLGITEKVATTLTACSGNFIKKMTPVLKLVDHPASGGLELLQKTFPIVAESPEKIYDSAVERLVKVTSPAVNTAVTVTGIGRKQVQRAVRMTFKACRKAMALVENRLEELEKCVSGLKHETVSAPQPAGEASGCTESAASTRCGSVRRAARRALSMAASASLFGVGAGCWLLERLPLVGRLLSEPYSPLSSPPFSRRRSTDSLYMSLSDVTTAGDGQRSPLPPQLSQATQ